MKKIKIATVFSGIGSVEFAFKRLNIPHEILFACDNGEVEINYDDVVEKKKVFNLSTPFEKMNYVDLLYQGKTRKHNFVKDTYLANYNVENGLFFQDVKLLDGKDFEDKVDLFVGGSPCQTFSQVGFQEGLNEARGTLFYEYARLVSEIKPRVFIYENVRNMLKHDNGKTWRTIKARLDELGYNINYAVLNSLDFNIPQKRNRLFVVGFAKEFNKMPDIPIKLNEMYIIPKYKMQDFLINNCAFGDFRYKDDGTLKIIRSSNNEVDERYFLSDAVKKYVLSEGTKDWHQKVAIDLPYARTLLKTMGNCHRAGVDNYITDKGRIRMLTEREALRLMGYTDDFICPVSVAQAYKQAGNSIVVDVMMALIKYIISTGIMED